MQDSVIKNSQALVSEFIKNKFRSPHSFGNQNFHQNDEIHTQSKQEHLTRAKYDILLNVIDSVEFLLKKSSPGYELIVIALVDSAEKTAF